MRIPIIISTKNKKTFLYKFNASNFNTKERKKPIRSIGITGSLIKAKKKTNSYNIGYRVLDGRIRFMAYRHYKGELYFIELHSIEIDKIKDNNIQYILKLEIENKMITFSIFEEKDDHTMEEINSSFVVGDLGSYCWLI